MIRRLYGLQCAFGEKPAGFVNGNIHEHIDNKQNCGNGENGVRPALFRGASTVGAPRRMAIYLIAVEYRRPTQNQKHARSRYNRHFPSVYKVMRFDHKGGHDGDTQPGQKAHKAENRWKHTTEYMRAFGYYNCPDKGFA